MKDIFERQKYLMDEVYKISRARESQVECYRTTTLAAVDELMEALHHVPWKPWSKRELWDWDELHKELVDVFTFFVQLCILSGLDDDKLRDGFFAKSKINKARQDSGTYGLGSDSLDITHEQLEKLYDAADLGECTSARVGCLIVGPDGGESLGWNRAFSDVPCTHPPEEGCPGRTVHAEVMALTDATDHGRPVKGGVAYVTQDPCDRCYYTLTSSGIKNIWVV